MPVISEPKNICCLRLSSIGDCINALATIQLIQKQQPQANITWLIGKTESSLMSGIPGINLITYNKKGGLKEYLRIKNILKNQSFDCLLDMQSSLKASLLSLLVKTPKKMGFDKERAMDMQQVFTNIKVKSPDSPHVIDGFMAFAKEIGCTPEKPVWDFHLTDSDYSVANKYKIDKSTVILSPCSSKDYKNWTIVGYIEICRFAISKGLKVAICTGKSKKEKAIADMIIEGCTNTIDKIINLSGKTSGRYQSIGSEMVRFKDRSNHDMLLGMTHEEAAVHMANALNVPVVGIYAHHNPARVGPCNFMKYAVSVYDTEIRKEHSDVSNLKWRTRVRNKHAMMTITSAEVKKAMNDVIIDYHL